MNIEGSVAFVTGANRGLARAYAEALLAAGAATVYAGARDPSSITDPRLISIKLDPTLPEDIAAALRNNPGALAAQMQATFDAGPSWAA